MPLTWPGDITLTTGPFGDLIILDSSYLQEYSSSVLWSVKISVFLSAITNFMSTFFTVLLTDWFRIFTDSNDSFHMLVFSKFMEDLEYIVYSDWAYSLVTRVHKAMNLLRYAWFTPDCLNNVHIWKQIM